MNAKRRKLPYRRGVGAVLINRDGLVFVARRIDTPGDAWQLPQGGIDGSEKASEAVLRELTEEIGTEGDFSNVLRLERRPYAYVALSAVRPLLVIAVGLFFAFVVAPGVVEDMRSNGDAEG